MITIENHVSFSTHNTSTFRFDVPEVIVCIVSVGSVYYVGAVLYDDYDSVTDAHEAAKSAALSNATPVHEETPL